MKKRPSHKNAPDYVFSNAQKLRKAPTAAENLLWEFLKSRKLNGLKFRRQHPIGSFIADFYCHELSLIIEIDGKIHEEKEAKWNDHLREQILTNFDLTVVRFSNEEVLENMNEVLVKIGMRKKT